MREWPVYVLLCVVPVILTATLPRGNNTVTRLQRVDTKDSDSRKTMTVTQLQPRSQRQTAPRRLGVFAAISQLLFGTARDIGNAYTQITRIVSNTIIPTGQGLQLNTTTSLVVTPSPDSNVTTTEEPYRITQQEALDIIRRNLYGLVRLFRREYRMALNDSKKNAVQADKELREALRPYFT